MSDRPIDETLAECRAIAAQPDGLTQQPVGYPPRAATLVEAHFRAECEQRPVECIHNGRPVIIWPIGAKP